VDLNDLVAAMLKMLRRLVREDVELELIPGRGPLGVDVDPGQIELVLFSSGYTDSSIHEGFVLDEGVELIAKPYTAGELLRRVRDLLDRPKEQYAGLILLCGLCREGRSSFRVLPPGRAACPQCS
jgi:hypothetical protein